jgi:hypothetical protein
MLRVENILEQLDACCRDFLFPDLNNGYYYAVDARLHAFRDDERWALTVETVGYNPRGVNLFDVLHTYGNCLTRGRPGFENEDFLARVDNMAEVEDRDNPEVYRGDVPIIVRGVPLAVTARAGEYLWETFRRLVPAHRDLLLADERELRARIPEDLPEVLRLDQWHQPDLLEQPPSAGEVYRLVAEVITTGDVARYRPTLAPNTHWSNWPDSGAL